MPEVEHEAHDVNPRAVARVAIVLAVLVAMVAALSVGLFALLASRERRRDPPPPALAQHPSGRLPPEPRLQSLPFAAIERLRAEEDRLLTTYGWVDRSAGTVRIPIEEAMRIYVARAGGQRAAPPVASPSPPPSGPPSRGHP